MGWAPTKTWSAVRAGLRATWRAIHEHRTLFIAVAFCVLVLHLVVPLAFLSISRKPWDHFHLNVWLWHLPRWVMASEMSMGRKIRFLSTVTLCWFSAGAPPITSNWVFFVGINDLARWMLTSVLFGAFFATAAEARAVFVRRTEGWWTTGRRDGIIGAVLVTLVLLTSRCTVRGYGMPVLPVIAIALDGLNVSILALLMAASRLIALTSGVGVTLAIVARGWVLSRS